MATKRKTVVGKEDLRRLMKEQRRSNKADAKKIESPLAKYNSMGQLSCIVCSVPVKSALMWNAHVLGKTHKENVQKLKVQKEAEFLQPAAPPVKRKPPYPGSEGLVSKRARADGGNSKSASKGLPADFFDSGANKSTSSGSLGLGGYSSSEEDDDKDVDRVPAPSTGGGDGSVNSKLPADFFDQGVMPSTSEKKGDEEEKPMTMAEKLPEGFFDDPKQDARIRQVEYRDKLDDEWDLFQKAIKEETTISEAIVAEDDEEATVDRKIEEIDEQMLRWSKIDRLQKQKEEIMASEVKKPLDASRRTEEVKEEDSENEDNTDEQEFEEFLDWRSKKAWK